MKRTYLPGDIHDRILDLIKEHNISQAELALKIGCSESKFSRFLNGNSGNLNDEEIIRIARVFNVSTDFLLGEVNEPGRKNYDVSELGLSVQSARNLYTGKVDAEVVNHLLENPNFAGTARLISRYLNTDLAKGIAAQNQLYASVASKLTPKAAQDVKDLQTPIYQADLTAIQSSFMKVIHDIKSDNSVEINKSRNLTDEAVQSIYENLTKGEENLPPIVTPDMVADAVAESVSHTGVSTKFVRWIFLKLIGQTTK